METVRDAAEPGLAVGGEVDPVGRIVTVPVMVGIEAVTVVGTVGGGALPSNPARTDSCTE